MSASDYPSAGMYRYGARTVVSLPVDASTSAITVGDFLVLGTAGYVQQAAAGDVPIAVAVSSVASPSADGGAYVTADVSLESVYECKPDAGSVTAALLGKTMDLGGARTINIDAGVDNCVRCVKADAVNNTVYVSLMPANYTTVAVG